MPLAEDGKNPSSGKSDSAVRTQLPNIWPFGGCSDFIEYIDDFVNRVSANREYTVDNSAVHSRSAFLFSLLNLEGVGRAAAYKLFTSFDSFDDIRRYPDEQIATRLRRIPKVTSILAQLGDPEVTSQLYSQELERVETLHAKGIHVITPDHHAWPPLFSQVSPSARPSFLYVYGNTQLLDQPTVAIHIPVGPASDSAFVAVFSRLDRNSVPVVVKEDEYATLPSDYSPVILVLLTGLDAVTQEARETIRKAVSRGGLIVSPFEPAHQHFRHDIPYLNTTVNGLGKVVVYSDIDYEHPSFDEMLRLTESGLPIFTINVNHELPDGIHPVYTIEDAEWIFASVGVAAL